MPQNNTKRWLPFLTLLLGLSWAFPIAISASTLTPTPTPLPSGCAVNPTSFNTPVALANGTASGISELTSNPFQGSTGSYSSGLVLIVIASLTSNPLPTVTSVSWNSQTLNRWSGSGVIGAVSEQIYYLAITQGATSQVTINFSAAASGQDWMVEGLDYYGSNALMPIGNFNSATQSASTFTDSLSTFAPNSTALDLMFATGATAPSSYPQITSGNDLGSSPGTNMYFSAYDQPEAIPVAYSLNYTNSSSSTFDTLTLEIEAPVCPTATPTFTSSPIATASDTPPPSNTPTPVATACSGVAPSAVGTMTTFGPGTDQGSLSLSLGSASFNAGTGNGILLVMIVSQSSQPIPLITGAYYGSLTMNAAVGPVTSGGITLQGFYISGTASTLNAVSLSFASLPASQVILAEYGSLQGVNTNAPFVGSVQTEAQSSTSFSDTLTTVSNDSAILDFLFSNNGTITATSGETPLAPSLGGGSFYNLPFLYGSGNSGPYALSYSNPGVYSFNDFLMEVRAPSCVLPTATPSVTVPPTPSWTPTPGPTACSFPMASAPITVITSSSCGASGTDSVGNATLQVTLGLPSLLLFMITSQAADPLPSISSVQFNSLPMIAVSAPVTAGNITTQMFYSTGLATVSAPIIVNFASLPSSQPWTLSYLSFSNINIAAPFSVGNYQTAVQSATSFSDSINTTSTDSVALDFLWQTTANTVVGQSGQTSLGTLTDLLTVTGFVQSASSAGLQNLAYLNSTGGVFDTFTYELHGAPCAGTLTVSPSPSLSSTLSPTLSPTPSSTMSPTLTATPSPTFSLSATPSLSWTSTPSPTSSYSPSDTPSLTPSPTLSFTLTSLPSPSASPSLSPSLTASPTATLQITATITPVLSPTLSPTISPTWTISYSPTISNTPQPTATAAVPVVTNHNHFNPAMGQSCTISMLAPQAGTVTVKIFTLAGEQVVELFNQNVQAGLWIQATWDGHNKNGSMVANGIYFISVRGAGLSSVKKVIVLK